MLLYGAHTLLNSMPMSFFSGLLGALGNVASSIPVIGGPIQGILEGEAESQELDENIKRQSKFQKELMAIQNQYNIDAFNRENAYNSPTAVLNRMNQAGLNANFLNGAQFSQSADQNSNVNSSGPDIGSTLSSMAQKRSLQLEKERYKLEKAKTKSEINLNEQSAEKARKEGILAMSQADKIENADIGNVQQSTQNMVTAESKMATEIREVEQNINNLRQSEKLLAQQTQYQQLVNDNYVEYMQAQIDQLIAQGKLDEAKAMSEQQLLPYIKRNYDASIYKSYQDVAIAREQLQVNWYEAKTKRYAFNEDVRHNLVVEQIERNRNRIQEKAVDGVNRLYDSQSDLIKAQYIKQAIDNAVEAILFDMEAYKVSYDTSYAILQKTRAETNKLVEEKNYLNKENATYWTKYVIDQVLKGSEIYKNVLGTNAKVLDNLIPF